MTRAYTPRRCGARWLDGDCPEKVLAIIDLGPKEIDPHRYDVFYTTTFGADDPRGPYIEYVCLTQHGALYHGDMPYHQVAAYRYRMKSRYAKWSTLPDAVKAAVRRDLES